MSNVSKNWRISDLQKEEKVSKISAKINVTAFQKWKETMLQISPTDGARRCGGILKVDLLGAVFTKVVLNISIVFHRFLSNSSDIFTNLEFRIYPFF